MDYNIEEGIIFNGDKEEINQLMGIFIDNAVKHSFENTCIKVESENNITKFSAKLPINVRKK